MTEPGRLYRGGMSHAENAESAEGRGMFGVRSDETSPSFLSTQPLRPSRSLREEKTRAVGLAGEMPHAENAEGAEGRGVLGMRAVEVGRLNHLSQPLRSLREEKTVLTGSPHAAGVAGEMSHADVCKRKAGMR